jgi:asparagine N-glycosylation enzyme membrane subunit Stt3
MRENTPPNAVVFAWWDYGYWITALGDRRSLADNGTQNSTQIAMIAQTFLDNATMALPNLRRYNVTYAAVFVTPSGQTQGQSGAVGSFQGFGEDGKWYWMARIGNNTMWNGYKVLFKEVPNPQTRSSTYYQIIMNVTNSRILGNRTITEGSVPNQDTMLGYMFTRATLSQSPVSPYFTQVFSSSNRYVLLFKVNYAIGTTIKMNSIKNKITVGDNVTLTGNLTDTAGKPLTGGPYTVSLEYSTDSGQNWNTVRTTIQVSPEGKFNFTWAPFAGTYLMRVHYLGTEGVYLESNTQPQLLNVLKQDITFKLSASTTTASVGQPVTLSWQMQPFVNYANVTLAYTFDDKTYTPIKSFLMTSSTMEYTWTVTVPGPFRLVVQWTGNENFNPSACLPVQMNKS